MARYTDLLALRRQVFGKHETWEASVTSVLHHADEDAARYDNALVSRFYRIVKPDEHYKGPPMLVPLTTQSVSFSFDTADFSDEPMEPIYYLDDDCKLYEVTTGEMHRFNTDEDETPFHYAASDLIANGKIVGEVLYTDH